MTDHDALIQQARNEVENLVGPMDKARSEFLSETVGWAREWIPEAVRSALERNAEFVQSTGVNVGDLRASVQEFLNNELEASVEELVGTSDLWLHLRVNHDSDERLPDLHGYSYVESTGLRAGPNPRLPYTFDRALSAATATPVTQLLIRHKVAPQARAFVSAPLPSQMMLSKLAHYGDLVEQYRAHVDEFRRRRERKAADEVLGDWDASDS